MKVACLNAFPPGPKSAGLNLSLIPLSRAIEGLGHALILFAPTPHAKFVRLSGEGHEYWRTTSARLEGLPLEIRDAVATTLTHLSERAFPPIFGLSDLTLAMDRSWESVDNFDAVMAYKPYFRCALPCLRAAQRANVPAILWFDDFDVDPAARFLARFDLVVCNSSALASRIRGTRVLYLPHIIDLGPTDTIDETSAGQNARGILILFPSTGFSSKEADVVINSCLSAGEGLPVYVVNCPPTALRGSPGVASREGLIRLPYLPRSDLLGLISRQLIAVIPQPDNPYGHSKASGRLLECLALGIPSVVPDSGESKLIIESGRCGVVYDPREPSTLATAVRTLRGNPELRVEMGQAARRTTRARGTWAAHARAFVDAIQDLVHDRAGVGTRED